MFKKSARLTNAEFSEFFTVGKRHHSKHLTIITHPHSTIKTAVVVGKKVAKSAVRRNTLRRRVYAMLRLIMATYPKPGVYIVVLKPSFAGLPRRLAQAEFESMVAQVLKTA